MSSRSCEDEATVIPGEQPCICPPPCISTLTQYSPCPRCRHPHKSRGSIPSNEDADRKPAVLFGVSLDQNYSVQKENIGCLKYCRIFLFILSMLIIRLCFQTHPGNRRCAGSIQGSRTKSCWSSSIKVNIHSLLSFRLSTLILRSLGSLE